MLFLQVLLFPKPWRYFCNGALSTRHATRLSPTRARIGSIAIHRLLRAGWRGSQGPLVTGPCGADRMPRDTDRPLPLT